MKIALFTILWALIQLHIISPSLDHPWCNALSFYYCLCRHLTVLHFQLSLLSKCTRAQLDLGHDNRRPSFFECSANFSTQSCLYLPEHHELHLRCCIVTIRNTWTLKYLLWKLSILGEWRLYLAWNVVPLSSTTLATLQIIIMLM